MRHCTSQYHAQYLPAFVIVDEQGQPIGPIQDGDAVIGFNFRGDRMIEISKAFEYADEQFRYFNRVRFPKVRFVCPACFESIDLVIFPSLLSPRLVYCCCFLHSILPSPIPIQYNAMKCRFTTQA